MRASEQEPAQREQGPAQREQGQDRCDCSALAKPLHTALCRQPQRGSDFPSRTAATAGQVPGPAPLSTGLCKAVGQKAQVPSELLREAKRMDWGRKPSEDGDTSVIK